MVPREKDPPDCEATIEYLRSAIEMTELVEAGALKASIEGQPTYRHWDREIFLGKLQELIDRKSTIKLLGGPYDHFMLVKGMATAQSNHPQHLSNVTQTGDRAANAS